MENFNGSSVLVQTIVDVKWGMEDPPDLRMSFYDSAHVRKGLQQVDMVKQIIANCSVVPG